MASILVTGCEEDGADQSANVASGLTSPRPPHTACLRISRRVCVHIARGRSSEKSRLTCLAQVGGHPRPCTPPRPTARSRRPIQMRSAGTRRRGRCPDKSKRAGRPRRIFSSSHSVSGFADMDISRTRINRPRDYSLLILLPIVPRPSDARLDGNGTFT
jgi:hypothetical protein